MRQKIKTYRNPNESAFLGLFVGKKKEREAEARAKILEAERLKEIAIAKAKQETLRLEIEAAKIGYDPNAETRMITAKAGGEQTLYYALGGIVAIVMIAIVLIKRKK